MSTVWKKVPELAIYFQMVEQKVIEGKEAPKAETTTAIKRKSKKQHSRRPANKVNDNKLDSLLGQTGRQECSKYVNNKDNSYPCSTCNGSNYCFRKCYLVWGKDQK